jgi:hypothetical protein
MIFSPASRRRGQSNESALDRYLEGEIEIIGDV